MWCYICFIKQKTAYEMRISDWSSDVCSADLADPQEGQRPRRSAEAEAALCGRCDLGLGEVSSGELLLAADPHGRLARVVLEPLDVEHAVEVVEIGRASCRERVGPYVEISVVALPLTQHTTLTFTIYNT